MEVALKLLLIAICLTMLLGTIIDPNENTRKHYCLVLIVSLVLTVITFIYLK